MTVLQNIVLTVIEFIAIILLLKKIVNEKPYNFLFYTFLLFCLDIFLEALKQKAFGSYMPFLNFCIFTIYINIVFKKGLLVSAVLNIYMSLLLNFIQLFFTGLLMLFVSEMDFLFPYGFIVMVLTLLTSLSLYLFAPFYIVSEFLEERKGLSNVILISAVIVIGIMHYLKLKGAEFVFSYNLVLIVSMFILMLLGYYGVKYSIELREKDKALEEYNKYKQLVSEYGTKQHEYDKHLQALNSYAHFTDKKDALYLKEYINDLVANSANDYVELLKLKRKVLGAYIHGKMNELKQKGIHVELEINDYELVSKLKDYKLVEMVGILIDNAYEASDANNKDIIVKIAKENSRTAIEVLNKHEYLKYSYLKTMYQKGYSTKGDNRGIGLYNLKKAIDENNCKIIFENKNIDTENYVSIKLLI